MSNVKSAYVSEFTSWLNDTLAQNSDWGAEQLAGRAIWWDKLNNSQEKPTPERVAQKPHPYDVNFN